MNRSQHQARIDRLIACRQYKGCHGSAINYPVAFVRKFFSTRRIIVVWTKPAEHIPVIATLQAFFLIGNSSIPRSGF